MVKVTVSVSIIGSSKSLLAAGGFEIVKVLWLHKSEPATSRRALAKVKILIDLAASGWSPHRFGIFFFSKFVRKITSLRFFNDCLTSSGCVGSKFSDLAEMLSSWVLCCNWRKIAMLLSREKCGPQLRAHIFFSSSVRYKPVSWTPCMMARWWWWQLALISIYSHLI